ncbi:MAG: hypothetical protein GXY39_04140 [Actinomycetales bacterium]|nr:hypothetical protein [Tetrasphaera sp.]NLW98874.1 hypothetical protein [Actinomycetales bacterium]
MAPSTKRTGDQPAPSGEPEQGSLWQEIKWDVVVLAFGVAALLANLLIPDALSPGLAPLLFLAVAWVAYRISQKVRARREGT